MRQWRGYQWKKHRAQVPRGSLGEMDEELGRDSPSKAQSSTGETTDSRPGTLQPSQMDEELPRRSDLITTVRIPAPLQDEDDSGSPPEPCSYTTLIEYFGSDMLTVKTTQILPTHDAPGGSQHVDRLNSLNREDDKMSANDHEEELLRRAYIEKESLKLSELANKLRTLRNQDNSAAGLKNSSDHAASLDLRHKEKDVCEEMPGLDEILSKVGRNYREAAARAFSIDQQKSDSTPPQPAQQVPSPHDPSLTYGRGIIQSPSSAKGHGRQRLKQGKHIGSGTSTTRRSRHGRTPKILGRAPVAYASTQCTINRSM